MGKVLLKEQINDLEFEKINRSRQVCVESRCKVQCSTRFCRRLIGLHDNINAYYMAASKFQYHITIKKNTNLYGRDHA